MPAKPLVPLCRLAAIAASAVVSLAASPVTEAGARLAAFYDGLEVERHWLPGRHIDWRTGDPDSGRPGKTHCSAFVAAACERLGIELLHPPEHGQKNLANAQFRWLVAHGAEAGWRGVATPLEAQRLANEGLVVAVAHHNPNPRKSGHIALVRPSDKPVALIRSEGPQIIQAGGTNASSIPLRKGFKHHRGAWVSADDFQVRFFAHPLPAQ